MLEIFVNYRIRVKTNIYSIDLLLVFHKYMIVSNESNYAFNSVYNKNIGFSQKWSIQLTQKILKIIVKYRIAKKTNDYSVDFFLIF